MPITGCPCPASTCAAPAPTPAAASPACPGATLPLESFEISGAAAGLGRVDVSLSGGEHPILTTGRTLAGPTTRDDLHEHAKTKTAGDEAVRPGGRSHQSYHGRQGRRHGR